jgi:hypothetical protein
MSEVIEVREIVIDHSSSINEIDEVNEMLKDDWVLIGVFQRGYVSDDESFYASVYTLGRKKRAGFTN